MPKTFHDDAEPIDYVFLDINDSYTRLLGVTRDMAIGKRIREVMPKVEQYWIDVFGKVAQTSKNGLAGILMTSLA